MSDFAQQALEELQKVTGSDNRDNPWLGVVAAVYLWHTRIEQLTKACEALLDAHDQSFVGREEMRDLYYSAHPRRAAAYKQARKAIESVRGIEASYPDPGCEAAARELADIAAVLRTGSSGDTLLGKEVSHWIDTAHAAEQERDDLRARLTKQVKAWRKDGRYDKTAASVFDACADKVEEILAKTEAK